MGETAADKKGEMEVPHGAALEGSSGVNLLLRSRGIKSISNKFLRKRMINAI